VSVAVGCERYSVRVNMGQQVLRCFYILAFIVSYLKSEDTDGETNMARMTKLFIKYVYINIIYYINIC